MGKPLLIAHRGGAAEAPENTLAAFRHSLALGIGRVELDVRMSKDGALVAMHDDTVERTTSGKGAVGALLLEELRRLDAGSWFGPRYKGEVIPTLREVLELCASESAGVVVELKCPHLYPGMEERAASLVRELWPRGASNVWCVSFSREAIGRLREIDRGLFLGQIYGPNITDFAPLDDRVEVICSHYSLVERYPEQVAWAHGLGKSVFVWTVNGEAGMRRMTELGVDGVISDRPSSLLRVLGVGF